MSDAFTLYRYTDADGVRWNVPQHRLWNWLKAENHHRPPKENLTRIPNRAMRRRAA